MSKTDRSGDHQFAALPYRADADGGYQVMLVTSRETGRWVVPKGWPMKGKKPARVAEIEAAQEAGIRGKIGRKPLGAFPYTKRMPDGEERLIHVTLYPLLVTDERPSWREDRERQRSWFSQEEASGQVEEGQLAQLILDLERHALTDDSRKRNRMLPEAGMSVLAY
jgi:8-oxo-dGTP pyrophosphatase MutT (NUDIX family)